MTQRRLKSHYNYDQAVRVSEDAPATTPVADPVKISHVVERTRVSEQALVSLQTSRGIDESVVLSASRTSVFQEFGAVPTQTILVFTVPNGCVFIVEALAWKFTDPFFAMSNVYRVELWVNDTSVPFWADANQAQFPGPGRSLGYGTFESPLRIEPIYLPGGVILRIALTETDTDFSSFVACSCRVLGQLRKVGGFA